MTRIAPATLWVMALLLAQVPAVMATDDNKAGKAAGAQGHHILPMEVTITDGSSEGAWVPVIKRLPGSGTLLDRKTLEKGNHTDISRVLRQVPGVNVQEEDGVGLRPNIGMRGGRIDRSADITLLEDGVLAAPAPYAAPAAYYFPRIERMTGLEVLKGPAAIKYGPRTTNGALNLLSAPAPDYFTGNATTAVGTDGGLRSGIRFGDRLGDSGFAYGLEGWTTKSDGFKRIDRVGGDTGFVVQDFLGKLRYKTDVGARYYQEIDLKAGYMDEDSHETYMGLTNADFLQDPYRRYASSQNDTMEGHHTQYQLSHYIEPKRGMGITTTLYRNNFDRNWYRAASVLSGGSRSTITDILNNPTVLPNHLAILRGDVDSAAGAVRLRANKRRYVSYGLQSALSWNTVLAGVTNKIEAGVRYHYDEEDRYQKEDDYQITGGVLRLTSAGAPGSQANRTGSAKAVATYAQNRLEFGKLAVTPGVRYEWITLRNEDFGTADPDRNGTNRRTFTSRLTALTPGLSADYALTDKWTALAGIHRGFAPPEPPTSTALAENAQEEKSTNIEAGVRYTGADTWGDLIGFVTHYENLLGRDSLSAGGSGDAEQFNGGEVNVHGLEAALHHDLSAWLHRDTAARLRPYRLPVSVGYTYTHSEFQNNFVSSFAEWGTVDKGDSLPYIPEHQFSVSAGIETPVWLLNLTARYTDRMRTVAGQGDFTDLESTDASIVLDANAEYEVTRGLRLFVNANNLLDEQYVAARRPSGVRPGAPQAVFAGIKVAF